MRAHRQTHRVTSHRRSPCCAVLWVASAPAGLAVSAAGPHISTSAWCDGCGGDGAQHGPPQLACTRSHPALPRTSQQEPRRAVRETSDRHRVRAPRAGMACGHGARTASAKLVVAAAVDDPPHAHLAQRGGAHNARLHRHVERALRDLVECDAVTPARAPAHSGHLASRCSGCHLSRSARGGSGTCPRAAGRACGAQARCGGGGRRARGGRTGASHQSPRAPRAVCRCTRRRCCCGHGQ